MVHEILQNKRAKCAHASKKIQTQGLLTVRLRRAAHGKVHTYVPSLVPRNSMRGKGLVHTVCTCAL